MRFFNFFIADIQTIKILKFCSPLLIFDIIMFFFITSVMQISGPWSNKALIKNLYEEA